MSSRCVVRSTVRVASSRPRPGPTVGRGDETAGRFGSCRPTRRPTRRSCSPPDDEARPPGRQGDRAERTRTCRDPFIAAKRVPTTMRCVGNPALDVSLARLPKAELRCHIEGTMRYDTAFELARKNGVPLPDPSASHPAARPSRGSGHAHVGVLGAAHPPGLGPRRLREPGRRRRGGGGLPRGVVHAGAPPRCRSAPGRHHRRAARRHHRRREGDRCRLPADPRARRRRPGRPTGFDRRWRGRARGEPHRAAPAPPRHRRSRHRSRRRHRVTVRHARRLAGDR